MFCIRNKKKQFHHLIHAMIYIIAMSKYIILFLIGLCIQHALRYIKNLDKALLYALWAFIRSLKVFALF